MIESSHEHSIRVRTEFGLRADGEWVDHVAEVGRDGGMTLNIPLTDEESAELHARTDRAVALGAALREAALSSAAGSWIDQAAGGVVHVLLAAPGVAELETAAAIVAERHAVIDLVRHSTEQLEHVRTLVHDASRRDGEFAAAIVAYGIAVRDNVLELLLRDDCDLPLPEPLLAAEAGGTLHIERTTERFHED